jgi:hypothetical protein
MQKQAVPANVEVVGQSLLAILNALELIKTQAQKLLADHGIPKIEPEGWYSMRHAIAAIDAIEQKIGPVTMRAVGRKVPEHARFPPEVRTLREALQVLDAAYQMNHRGHQHGNIGGYHFEPTGDRAGRMVCDTPYSCNFDHGVIEAICERFRPKDAAWVRVDHGSGCRQKGSVACIYHIRW